MLDLKSSPQRKSFTENLGKVIFIFQILLKIKEFTDLEVLEHTHTSLNFVYAVETYFLLP